MTFVIIPGIAAIPAADFPLSNAEEAVGAAVGSSLAFVQQILDLTFGAPDEIFKDFEVFPPLIISVFSLGS